MTEEDLKFDVTSASGKNSRMATAGFQPEPQQLNEPVRAQHRLSACAEDLLQDHFVPTKGTHMLLRSRRVTFHPE